jgi:hypothetical protein
LVKEKNIKMREGIDSNNNFLFEIFHFSLGKKREKTKNVKGAILVATKLILTQNNLQDGS